jgi:hypothetical protein
MIALVSAKGSPGTTTSALAFTLSWPGNTLLAECDPSGGDVLAGFLEGRLDSQRGLAQLAVAELRGRMADEFERQLIDLDSPRRQRLVLPGLKDPAQSATVGPVWPAIAEQLRNLTNAHIIADCGRISSPYFGWPVLNAADVVLLTLRGTLPSISHAVPAVQTLRRELTQPHRIGLLVIDTGPYPPGDISGRLGVPLAAILPYDPTTAQALSFGGSVHRRRPLARAAAATWGLSTTREVAGAGRAG